MRPWQKEALQALFQQNRYPGITTRERLAQELDIPESRIQVGLSFSFILPGAQVVDTIWLKPVHINLHVQLGAQLLWVLFGHSRGPHAL